jgi:7-cyano-7-deazaguanine synthase
MRRAIVLFSGGLDSTTVVSIAKSAGYEPVALIFDYGQRHRVEVDLARRSAGRWGIEFRVQHIDLRAAGGSALTSDAIAVPKGRSAQDIAREPIPPTYVPARNTIFLAFALAWAEVESIDDIFIGVNALDFSGYPDCRPAYIEAFEKVANLASRRATEGGIPLRIHAPLLQLGKAEIITRGLSLGVDYADTWSCYSPVLSRGAAGTDEPRACGVCDSCVLRRQGFAKAGVPDPTRYCAEAAAPERSPRAV